MTFGSIIGSISGFMYTYLLVILLIAGGLWFTLRTRCVQFRMLGESIKVVMEKPEKEGAVSSFQALMVSTASRVGTGNIVGVATAICLGGYGAVFWMSSPSSAAALLSSRAPWPRFTSAALPTAPATAAPLTTFRTA